MAADSIDVAVGLPADRRNAIAKVSYTHDKVIDYIISRPRVTGAELSMVFGYTQAWLSQIMSSDAFKERLAFRRAEVIDPEIRAGLDVWFPTTTESMQHLVDKSLEVLKARLNQDKVPDAVALKALELGAKGLSIGGFGTARAPEPVSKPDVDRLERLADRLTGLLGRKRTEVVVEGEVIQS